MSAGPRFTTSPISAMRARPSSSTCCSGCCVTIYGDAHVTYVRNITDVDDKINARAAERGISIRELTEETALIYNEDMAALGCLPPTLTPRATEHVAEMVAMIEQS